MRDASGLPRKSLEIRAISPDNLSRSAMHIGAVNLLKSWGNWRSHSPSATGCSFIRKIKKRVVRTYVPLANNLMSLKAAGEHTA